MKIRCGILTEASRCPVAGTTQLLKQIAEISPGTDDTVCVEYCTGSEEKLVTTFTSCLETKGIHLAGGTVFGVPDGKSPVVAYNGELYEDACVYALIKNTTGKIRVYKENIYEKHRPRVTLPQKSMYPVKHSSNLTAGLPQTYTAQNLTFPVIKSSTTYWSILWDVR